jgi:NAD(P)-dependent dehydrogenase (short-subunit alcohol dehydrogenase family)
VSPSRGLAKLARVTGVTVNAVLPGPAMSAGVEHMLRDAAGKSAKAIEQVGADFVRTKRATSIIQRVASAEEVANMVVYACSPQASTTAGAAVRVEGGIVETIA